MLGDVDLAPLRRDDPPADYARAPSMLWTRSCSQCTSPALEYPPKWYISVGFSLQITGSRA